MGLICRLILRLSVAVAAVSANLGTLADTSSSRALVEEAGGYDFYDLLRQREDISLTEAPGSQIYEVTTGLGATYRLADIKSFLPFSNGTHLLDLNGGVINDAFTALLAVYHFNNIGKSPLMQDEADDDVLKSCNVRFTTELVDTEFSPIDVTRTFSGILQRETSIQVPPTAAVVGAFRSAVTSPLAILTGVSDIPQISWASTAVDFDVKEQFPVFGRTVTSTVGEATVAVRYFQSIGSTHVAILFVTDSFGSALQKSFQDAASTAGIQTESIAFSFDLDKQGDEARSAMEQLRQTQYRHVYAIMFNIHTEPLMRAAQDAGVVGPDYLYVSSFLVDSKLQTFAPDSPLLSLFRGGATINMQAGLAPKYATEDQGRSTGLESFLSSWQEARSDPAFVQYVKEKLPASLDQVVGFDRENLEFLVDPGEFRPFLYDAIYTLGLSMCRAGEQMQFFNGPGIYEEFRKLDLQGASGRLLIDQETGTRDYETIAFVMWNSRVLDGQDEDGNVRVEFVPSLQFKEGEWVEIPGNTFQFADGSDTAPGSLPPVEEDFNYVGKTGRIVGFILMGVTVVSAIVSLIWLLVNRNEHVVRAAQPFFLVLVSLGALVAVSTILPLSMEETTVARERGLDIACMSAPWLYIVGINIVFSALFAKTIGVHQAYMNPDLEYINVSSWDIIATGTILLLPNVIILTVWTIVSPLEWDRSYRSTTDVFLRPTESYGECGGEDAQIYASVVVVVNFLFLILGNFGVYQTRNIETEYSESRYIAVSLFAVLQAWCMGIPILAVTFDNPQGKFYVMSGIVFVTAQSTLSLVYLPKMMHLRMDRKKSREAADPKKEAYAAYNLRSSKPIVEEDDDQLGHADDDSDANDEFGESFAVLPEELPETGPAISALRSSSGENSKAMRLSSASSSGLRGSGSSFRGSGSSLRGSGRISSGPGGIKVIHNPKATQNLRMTGGVEMSREQLGFFVESMGAEDEPSRDGIEGELEEDEDADDEITSDVGHPAEKMTGIVENGLHLNANKGDDTNGDAELDYGNGHDMLVVEETNEDMAAVVSDEEAASDGEATEDQEHIQTSKTY